MIGLILLVVMLAAGCSSDREIHARREAAWLRIEQLNTLVLEYRKTEGRLPQSLAEVRSKYDPSAKLLLDPWGQPFVYMCSDNSYVLATFGRDNRPGPEATEESVTRAWDPDENLDLAIINGRYAGIHYQYGGSHPTPWR